MLTFHTGTTLDHGVTPRSGRDGLYMVGSHGVAHDCVIGDRVVMANNSALGGHVKIGDNVFIGGLAGLHQHSTRGPGLTSSGRTPRSPRTSSPSVRSGAPMPILEGLNLVGLRRHAGSAARPSTSCAPPTACYSPTKAPSRSAWTTRRTPSATAMAEVMEIVDFIRVDGTRPLCLPKPD